MTASAFTPALAFVAIAAIALLAAALHDLRRFEIPDGLAVAVLGSALGFGLVTPGFDWLSHLAAPVVVLAAGLVIFRMGVMGGGDIKLLVALAGWTGLAGLPRHWFAVVVAGGLLALLLLAARALAGPAPRPRLLQSGAPLPYAVAIAAGTGWWALGHWPPP